MRVGTKRSSVMTAAEGLHGGYLAQRGCCCTQFAGGAENVKVVCSNHKVQEAHKHCANYKVVDFL